MYPFKAEWARKPANHQTHNRRYKKLVNGGRGQTLTLQELINLAKENAAAVELDQSKVGRLSRMDALQKQAMSQEVNRRRHIELTRITAALARIEEGEFGFCITCGNKIGKERLALNPSLPQCAQCAAG